MQTGVELKKSVWDENDFEEMGWHDSKIYAMSFDQAKFELALDIDYIVKWVDPAKINFKFWVAPATLVFRNVYDLNISQLSLNFEIQDVQRRNPLKPKNSKHTNGMEYDWKIETTDGEITFKAGGYTQYFRKRPVLLETQRLEFKDRGGISFERSFD